MSTTDKPRPKISPDNQPFWDGCREGVLRLPWCRDCGRPHLVPGPVCPFCFSGGLEWRAASGRGRISTWVVVHKAWFPAFADDIPYDVVQVELAEGPRLTASLVDGREQPIAINQEVEVVFKTIDAELTLPKFRRVR